MTTRMTVADTELGIVRVFALNLAEAEVPRFTGRSAGDQDAPLPAPDADTPLRRALGADWLDQAFVDVFDVKTLSELGLSGYLIDGMGIAETQIVPDRARLDRQKGFVVTVMSRAFGGRAQRLSIRAPLAWLATYTEERPPVVFEPLPAAAARGVLGGPGGASADSGRRGGSHLLLGLVIFVGLAVGLLVLVAIARGNG